MEHEPSGKRRPIFDKYFHFIESKKPSDRLFLLVAIMVLLVSLTHALLTVNAAHKATVATSGGTFIEGIVGTPRFVNPVLAITRTDQDIVALIYSGIMGVSPDGSLKPDLADSVTISEDGLVYNIILREDGYFHDGTRVTSADIAFTVSLIQDPMLKSPLRGNWNDVSIEIINEKEFNIVLDEAYTPFLENLTVGILPKHVWEDLSIEQLPFSQHNTEPIGSGPYQLGKVTHNASGLIKSYTLNAADKGERTAKISNIVLEFYPNEETLVTALETGSVMGTAGLSYSTLPAIDTDQYTISTHPLPRVFALFFNQNKSAALRDPAVREALSASIDREQLVVSALDGYGVSTQSPIPPDFLMVDSASTTASSGLAYATSVLEAGGWEKQEDGSWQKEIDDVLTTLSISLTTANAEIFEETSLFVKEAWEALGVTVNIAYYEQADLVQTSIRPRDYQALLFGTEVGRFLDFYPFWHSSQKDDPGLNVALYTNIDVDAFLETARTTQDADERTEAIEAFEKEITSEHPAVFLYSPSFTYVVRNDITTVPTTRIVRPSERFSNVAAWHMSNSDVWPIFAN